MSVNYILSKQRQFYNNAIVRGENPYHGILHDIYLQEHIAFGLKHLKKNGAGKVLDLGCGDGTVCRSIAPHAYKVIGVDISEEAIKLAHTLTNANSNISYVCASIDEYSCEEQFDVVLLFEVLEHVYDPNLVLHKIYRWLSPNGLLCLSTPNRDSLGRLIRKKLGLPFSTGHEIHVKEHNLPEIKDMLRKQGFKMVDLKGIIIFSKLFQLFRFSRGLQRLVAKSGNLFPHWSINLLIAAKKA